MYKKQYAQSDAPILPESLKILSHLCRFTFILSTMSAGVFQKKLFPAFYMSGRLKEKVDIKSFQIYIS